MDSTEELTVLSLCSGYGGLDLGLSAAIQRPMRVVAVEIEAYALANLVEKAEQGKMAIEALWPDCKNFPAKEFSGCFDIITAGYPCQPFSVAGKRKGKADPRHLWPFIRDIVREIRPFQCFFENVAGHLSIGFDSVVRDLDDLGYRVEAGLFTASEVGAPHRRERLFILANSDLQPDGPNAGGDEKTGGVQGEHRPPLCRGGIVGTGEQLGDTTGQRPHRGAENGHRQQPEVSGEGFEDAGELVNAECAEQGGGKQRIKSETPKRGWDRPTEPSKRLADTGCCEQAGISRNSKSENGEAQERRSSDRRNQKFTSSCKFPARPGQPQHDWEEPRTVKPGLGRTANGPSARVDRLRLLGNGVVPAQAELAYRTLNNRITERNP